MKITVKDKIYTTKGVVVNVSSKKTTIVEEEPEIKIAKNLEFEDPKPDALLSIVPSKTKAYSGEGFDITVSFLIHQNEAEITLIDFSEQIAELKKKLKLPGCYIEEGVGSISFDTLTIKGKKYFTLKLYEGRFFSNDPTNIKIPPLDFSILTYFVARNKNGKSIERKPVIKVFSTKPFFIKIIPLPQNIRTENISVGNFSLTESISHNRLETGKSFKYTFTITGDGNIKGIQDPGYITSEYFDIYPPKVKTFYPGKNSGTKTFEYYITPKEPGDFNLSEVFKWPYFNIVTGKYDTLSSALTLKVRGESLKNNYISVNNPGGFYNKVNTDSNLLRSIAKKNDRRLWINMVILSMLIVTGILVFKK